MKKVKLNKLGLSILLMVMLFTSFNMFGQTISTQAAGGFLAQTFGDMKVVWKWLIYITLGALFVYAIYAHSVDGANTKRANTGLVVCVIVYTLGVLFGVVG